jgi:hypothetical protein
MTPSSSTKLDAALLNLQQHGHIIGTGHAVIGPTGLVLILVDGILCTHDEIYAMVNSTPTSPSYKDGQKVKLVEALGNYPVGTPGTISILDGTVWVVVGGTQQGGVKRFRLDHDSIIEPI